MTRGRRTRASAIETIRKQDFNFALDNSYKMLDFKTIIFLVRFLACISLIFPTSLFYLSVINMTIVKL